MRVAVDLDGPCYEWDKTARYMLRKFRGCEGLDDPSRDWLWHSQKWHSVTQEDWDWLWSEGIRKGLFRYGHMTKDARVGLERLIEMGHQLVVVTSRPVEAQNDTREWLAYYFKDIPLPAIHILSNGEPKHVVQAEVLIDDHFKNAEAWVRNTPVTEDRRALLFDRPWNQLKFLDNSGIYRVEGWEGVIEWFEKRTNRIS